MRADGVGAVIRELGRVRVGNAGVVRSAVVVDVAAEAAAAVVAIGQLGQLERTVSQRWLEIGLDGVVVGFVEVVEWVACCEGRGGGDVEQREVGRTCWVVVQGT